MSGIEVTQGTPLDYTYGGEPWRFAYMATRDDYQRQGLAGRLVEAVYDRWPDKKVDWGKVMDTGAGVLWERYRKSHPDRGNFGSNWYGRTSAVASAHGPDGRSTPHRGRGVAGDRPGTLDGASHRLAGDERRRPGQPGVGQERTKPPYTVKATKSAIADFQALQPGERTRVSNAIQKCRWEPHTFSKGLGGKLGGYRKIQIGDSLRVVLGIENKHITIYAVGQHENFYTKVIRRMKNDGLI